MLNVRREKCKRVFAVLMAAFLLVILFFAVSLSTDNLEHDCAGEHCPVCECLHVCESVIQQTGAGLVPVICFSLAIAAVCITALFFAAEVFPLNLITLKIRLNI